MLTNDRQLEQLLCSLMYLLARQANQPQGSLTQPITQHLQWLIEHPDSRSFPALRKVCHRLAINLTEGTCETRESGTKHSAPVDPTIH